MNPAHGSSHVRWRNSELLLGLVAVGLALWPIWAHAHFLTNDGPCHLYNARILRDMLLGQDTALYSQWYHLNPRFEPNWLAHALLAMFQLVLPPILSEKVLLTLYILGFAWAMRQAARTWFPENSALAFLILPFLFHKVFLLGFYNFTFSLALMLALMAHWPRQVGRPGWRPKAGLGLLASLLAFTHPVCFGVGMAWIASHWLGQVIATWRAHRPLGALGREAMGTALAVLPGVALVGTFVLGHDTTIVPSTIPFHTLWHDFIELDALVLYDKAERAWPIVIAVAIGLLTLVALVRRRWLGLQPQDMVLPLFAAIVWTYFHQPAQVGRVGIMPERLQPIPYLVIWLWLCAIPWPGWVRRAVMGLGFATTVILFSIRLPHFARSSDAVTELTSAQAHMRPGTTVVLLNYAPEGRAPHDGPLLSQEAYIYLHIAEYLGALQPHIILNNYEANTDWFPLRWNAGRDPYVHLSDGPGFEGWLPTADFEKFERETGQRVDYVIQWCRTAELLQYDGVQRMQARLSERYEEIYVSEGWRVRLWRHRATAP